MKEILYSFNWKTPYKLRTKVFTGGYRRHNIWSVFYMDKYGDLFHVHTIDLS